MVSDSELIGRLREFLRYSDLDTTTTGTVRRQLEEDFGVDLSDKKAFIREQVDLFLQSHFQDAGDDSQEKGDDDQTAQVQSEETDGSDLKEEEEEDDDDEGEEEANNGKSSANRGLSSNSGLTSERKTCKTQRTGEI